MSSSTITYTSYIPRDPLFLVLKRPPKTLLLSKVQAIAETLKASNTANIKNIETWYAEFETIESGEDVAEGLCFLLFHFIYPLIKAASEADKHRLNELQEQVSKMIADAIPEENTEEYIKSYRIYFIKEKAQSIIERGLEIGVCSKIESDEWWTNFNADETDEESLFEYLSQFLFQFIEPYGQKPLSSTQGEKLNQLSKELHGLIKGMVDSAEDFLVSSREYFIKRRVLSIITTMRENRLYSEGNEWWTLFEAVDMKTEEGRKEAMDLLCYFQRHYTRLPSANLLKYDDQIVSLMAAIIPNHHSVEMAITNYHSHADRLDLARKKHERIVGLTREKDERLCDSANRVNRELEQMLRDCRDRRLVILERERADVQLLRSKVGEITEKVKSALTDTDLAGLEILAKKKGELQSQCQTLIEMCRKLLKNHPTGVTT